MNFFAVTQIFIQLCWYYINGCQCQTSGDIRLVGGDSAVEGRVEVYFGGRWGTICDDLWDDQDATVICRQLGLSDNGSAVFHAAFGRGSGTIWLDNLECSGNENNLQECSYPGLGSHNCDHTEDAGVYCINDGEIRLINGLSSNKGRVEIFHDGQWGTVCDDGWGDTDAAVVCRQLGFSGTAVAFVSAWFGYGSGPIWLNNVECTGSERTLRECLNQGWGTLSCSHSEDAGVRCDDYGMDNDIRLRNGPSSNQGRVEVFHDGQWGTVCYDGWNDTAAEVVCRQLEFVGSAFAFSVPRPGEGSGIIWLDDVECTGMEQTLDRCEYSGWGVEYCDHSEVAGVSCDAAVTGTGGILLINGPSPREGRVEVFHDGQWGTVCDDSWDDTDAAVVCRQLGFNGSSIAILYAHFGLGNGPIWLDNVACNGYEESLQDCGNNGWGSHNCVHSEDAGVRCDTDNMEDVEIRLRNGLTSYEGRVEIFHAGQWGTVCDDGWDDAAAAVVCRQLGFNGSAVAFTSATFGQGSGAIWLDNVRCIGSEQNLQECTNPGFGVVDCLHIEDAGVRCEAGVTVNDYIKETASQKIRLVGGSAKNEGRVEVYIDDRWGTVCDDGWDDKDAVVVCRQLGFNTGGTAISQAAFGKGSGEILLDNVDCSGEEANLIECRSTEYGDCDHGEDASVRCNGKRIETNFIKDTIDVRLSYGLGLSEGRVEVYYDGQWGTVCDNSWNDVDAQVVCSQLGFSSGGTAVLRPFPGSITTRMRLHNVNCTGKETSLLLCDNSGWRNEKCQRTEDVGVTCIEDTVSCLNTPCFNGGTCIRLTNGYVCVCLNGFGGDNCEIEKEDITVYKPKGFPIFISLVCVLMVGALVFITVWIRRIQVLLDGQALISIEMQKRTTDNKPSECNRNEYNRQKIDKTPSDDSEEIYENEELYEDV
ncbi:Deleted in malignant brain tumors 1 protein [Holothuria leucospilota]|uniref:Deleted in malignant brain tumors 1 protein n=1 Tax=Holothuria leucospilota TaxID=206669 RepID=A0A9Q1CN45_HOLLE|nr:Deleted in malignant brain tumors 1 protein [Holothuria leucospilota]